jgi:hypothetical protein
MTAADSLYVVLTEHVCAYFLTDDHNLVDAPSLAASMCFGSQPGREEGRGRATFVQHPTERIGVRRYTRVESARPDVVP